MAKDKLEKLYQIMANSEELGVALSDDVISQINEMEERIIKEEVLPLLHEKIEPTLRPVKRKLVLVVDYDPNGPLKVTLSRRVNITKDIVDAKEITLDPIAEHRTVSVTHRTDTRQSASEMSVIFKDGVEISESKAVNTFIKAIQHIGVTNARRAVEALGLTCGYVPLISNRRDEKYGHAQKDLGGGWLLSTTLSNQRKKQMLDKISDYLHLGLKVIVKE